MDPKEELPPLWALDKAAKALGISFVGNWAEAQDGLNTNALLSVKAHARTIAQYEQPPVDEDESALLRILEAFGLEDRGAKHWREHTFWDFPAALAQFKRELEGRK